MQQKIGERTVIIKEHLLKTKKVANILNVSQRFVRNLIEDQKLKSIKTGRRHKILTPGFIEYLSERFNGIDGKEDFIIRLLIQSGIIQELKKTKI